MRDARVSRSDRWIYAAAWLALMTIYAAALVASGLDAGAAFRNAIVILLPDSILGLAVLRLPSVLPWPDGFRVRFFAGYLGALAAFLALVTGAWLALVVFDAVLFTGRASVSTYYRFIPFRLLIGMLIYGTLAGLAYARENAGAVREQAERAANAEALRARAELEALRSQVNPHFILNTYHALVGLVRRDPSLAESALEGLGDLLRYSLRVHRDGVDEVSLREECAFVHSYLALERLRLGDRLQVNFDVPAAAMNTLVPTFAVQILVENSIRHAIAPRAAGGLIRIRAEQAENLLHVSVTDECTGDFSENRLEGSRMGLRLLQERLAMLYGGAARLTLVPIDRGISATLEIPARHADGEQS